MKLACQFKCTKKLTSTPAVSVDQQLDVLKWYYEVLLYAEKSELGRYDVEYLLEIVAAQGFNQNMFQLYNDTINEDGKFENLDVFAEWIFNINELTPILMAKLCSKLVKQQMRADDPPNTLLKQHKKWLNLIDLAVIVTNGKLERHITTNEDEFIQVIFDELPHTYKKALRLHLAAKGRVRPHSWDELQDLVQLGWRLMKRDKKRYHPSKEMNFKENASELMGKRINAMRQRQQYRYNRGYRGRYGQYRGRRYRGRSRGRRGYRNRGYRGRATRGSRGRGSTRYTSYGQRGRGQGRGRGSNYYNRTRSGRGGNTSQYSSRQNNNNKQGRGNNNKNSKRNNNNNNKRNNIKKEKDTSNNSGYFDYRNMNIRDLTMDIFNNPENHYREYGICYDCNFPGHWQYACKLLATEKKKEFTSRARKSSSAMTVTQSFETNHNQQKETNNQQTSTSKRRRKRKNQKQKRRQKQKQQKSSSTNHVLHDNNDNNNNNQRTDKPIVGAIRHHSIRIPTGQDVNEIAKQIAALSAPHNQHH